MEQELEQPLEQELLTPEDVLKKTFQTTKFREGYDVEEVDDFLDLVLGTLRALYAENDALKAEPASHSSDDSAVHERVAQLEAELAAARDQISAAESSVAAAEAKVAEAELRASASTGEIGSVQEQAEQARAQAAAAEETARSLRAELDGVRAELAQKSTELSELQVAPAVAPPAESEAAAGIISLAQQLHDDHVRQGEEEAARLVTEANVESNRIVSEAQARSAKILADLERDRSDLEGKIEDLKTFERDYRGRLEESLKGFVSQLET